MKTPSASSPATAEILNLLSQNIFYHRCGSKLELLSQTFVPVQVETHFEFTQSKHLFASQSVAAEHLGLIQALLSHTCVPVQVEIHFEFTQSKHLLAAQSVGAEHCGSNMHCFHRLVCQYKLKHILH